MIHILFVRTHNAPRKSFAFYSTWRVLSYLAKRPFSCARVTPTLQSKQWRSESKQYLAFSLPSSRLDKEILASASGGH